MKMKTPRVRIVGLLAAVIVGTTAGATGIANKGSSDGATIYAEFSDASPLIVGNDVQVGGVKVGQIESIEVQDGRARVGLHLDPKALPVHTDARTTIRPVSLLGERFVALERGTPSAPVIADGGVLPVQQTGRATDLDEVLNTVDKPTGRALAVLVTTLGEGVRGQGKDVDAAVQALSPAMKDTGSLVHVLNEQNALLTSLVDRTQPVASALASDDGRKLDGLVGSTDQVLGAVAANQRAVDSSLAQLPGTLSAARAALSDVSGVAEQTTPTLESMRPTTNNLNAISGELQRFADSADPALASAQPVLQRAQELLDQAAPVVRELEAAGPDLRGTAGSLRPIGTALTSNLGNVLDFIRFWALTTNGHDGLSHYFRAHLVVSPETALGPAPVAPPAVPPGLTPPPGLPQLPLRQLPLPQLPGLGGSQPAGSDGGATGLTADQERSMLDHLVGGQ
ncbi:MlaD family protein [Saccharopolyspora sp. NPDC049426]|uniref:MlaD family protein n=1 Tax=Saccharopolyspora sp. NPDC049426 TaxID=3155652 RepID=UPI0034309F05